MEYKIYFEFQFEPNSVCKVHIVLKDLILFDHSILLSLAMYCFYTKLYTQK